MPSQGAGLALTLIGYLLLKLSPVTNSLILAASGYRLRAVVDPSDLWLLPALLIPAWLWFRPGIQNPSALALGSAARRPGAAGRAGRCRRARLRRYVLF